MSVEEGLLGIIQFKGLISEIQPRGESERDTFLYCNIGFNIYIFMASSDPKPGAAEKSYIRFSRSQTGKIAYFRLWN